MNVPTLYKGAGPGTHWHTNDARLSGFTAAAHRTRTANAVRTHIVAYSHPSPYISFTTSYAVARQYALTGPSGIASQHLPGYVYEVDLSACGANVQVFNPLADLSKSGLGHQHNGDQDLIIGVAEPHRHAGLLIANVPHAGGRMLPPSISQSLWALVNAVRDAEVLLDSVPAGCVVVQHPVW
jgi:hypothetical protein